MATLTYVGTSDEYILNAADLKRHGVEGFKHTVFPKNVAVEDVDDEAAAKIVELMGGDFVEGGQAEKAAQTDEHLVSDDKPGDPPAGETLTDQNLTAPGVESEGGRARKR